MYIQKEKHRIFLLSLRKMDKYNKTEHYQTRKKKKETSNIVIEFEDNLLNKTQMPFQSVIRRTSAGNQMGIN